MAFMNSPRIRALTSISVLSLTAVLALAACSQPAPEASPSGSPATSTAGSPSGSPQTGQTGTGQTPGSTSSVAVQCTAGMLSGSTDSAGGGAAGHLEMRLLVKNTSNQPCFMDGYPGVSLVGKGNGTQLGAAAERNPAQPSAGQVTLAPGASAQAALRYTQAGNYQSACSQTAADGLRVYPPGATDALYIPQPLTACTEDSVVLLQIGAFSAA